MSDVEGWNTKTACKGRAEGFAQAVAVAVCTRWEGHYITRLS